MTQRPSPDHRSLVGARRSDRTRQRLIRAAILVVARRGIGPSLIDDVAREANVSRSTFYNHFQGIPDLLEAADQTLADEVIQLILGRIAPISDPAVACATGLGLFLMAARDYPLVAQFSAQVGLSKPEPLDLVQEVGAALLECGVKTGRFIAMPVPLALGLVSWGMAMAMQHQVEGTAFDIPVTIAALLRLLGVPPAEAALLAARPVEPLRAPANALMALGQNALQLGTAANS